MIRTRLRARGQSPWYVAGKADGTDPSLWLDFANQRYAVNGATKSRADILTFTRASTATYFDSTGTMQTAAINAPRFEYDPVTLQPKGILIEGQRTNLVLNSATGSNQNITTSATNYTLSFYGTGTVTLSGTYAGSLIGSGAFPTRSSLTFTATAGTLTIAVSGMIQYIQIEAGAFKSSYIPTTGASVTRSADVCSNSAANTVPFASWYNQTEGTFLVEFTKDSLALSEERFMTVNDGTSNNRIYQQLSASTYTRGSVIVGTVWQGDVSHTPFSTTEVNKFAHAVKANNVASSLNGSAVQTDASVSMPTVSRAIIGEIFFGTIKSIRYYQIRVTNADIVRITT